MEDSYTTGLSDYSSQGRHIIGDDAGHTYFQQPFHFDRIVGHSAKQRLHLMSLVLIRVQIESVCPYQERRTCCRF